MSRYIDENSIVDKVGLQQFAAEQLIKLRQTADEICTEHHSFWDEVRVLIGTELHDADRERALLVLNQLVHLPHYIQMWRDTSVDTVERFDFFVMTKAHEIQSQDQTKDYFWALQIRHDQLIALVTVLTSLLTCMADWITKPANTLFDDSIFSGLADIGIEDQVYLEAERIYKERSHGSG